MKDKLFRLILCVSVVQQFLFYSMREAVPKLSFLYGVPLTSQVSFHTLLFGYWFLPIFFVVHYFSGYISGMNSYKTLLIMRNGKGRFFVRRLLEMFRDLFALVFLQFLIYMGANLLWKMFDFEHGKLFGGQDVSGIILAMINYFVVIFIIALMENLFEMIFENRNINVIVNIFMILSVFLYNFNNSCRNGVFRLVNIAMCARTDTLKLEEYFCLCIVIFVIIGIMFWKWKRKDLLGEKYHD